MLRINKEKEFVVLLVIVEVIWVALLVCCLLVLIQTITARADEPNIIMNGEYVIAEIHTQDDAIDIQEAPPINRLSDALEATDSASTVYSGISLSESDYDLLRRIVALESQGEIFRGQKAVVEVIFNRILSKKWPNDLESVIYQKKQFATVKYLKKPYAVPGEAEDDAISEVLRETVTELPDLDYVFFSTHKVNGKEFVKIGNHYFSKD